MKSILSLMFIFSSAITYGATNGNEIQEILLRDKKINLGKVNGDSVQNVNKTIRLIRDDKSPKKVSISLDYNKLKKSCVEYTVKKRPVKELKVKSCDIDTSGVLDTYNCEDKTFESFDILKRVCSKKGLVLMNSTKTIDFLFYRSVALAPGAKEIFVVNINQPKINSPALKVKAEVSESSSLYKINNIFNRIIEVNAKH